MSFQKLIKAAGIVMLVLAAHLSFAQNTRIISGTVTDSKDRSVLRGVSVTAKGSGSGTQTGENGTFQLTVDNSVTVLIFSSVGYETQEVSIAGINSVDVVMVLSSNSLGEVVVIGYGTARRKDLTGAITTVNSKDFNKGPLTSPEQLINGKLPGVQITAPSGAPGAGGRIRVRGTSSLSASNDPLIIIDGVPVDQTGGISGSSNPLGLINPNDIETFTVLKDASATAIYGNRATNGVIIITTKKGRTGKVSVGFSTYNSLSVPTEKVDVLNADEFRAMVNSKGNTGQKTLLGNANTNWQDQIYEKAFRTDNNINLSGGIAKLPYRLSFGFLKEEGILKEGSLRRFSNALNINPRLFNNSLKVDMNVKYSSSHYEFANEGAIGAAVFFDPTQEIKRSDNRFFGYWEWIDPSSNQPDVLAPKNPLGLLDLRKDNSDVDRLITNLQLDYTLPFLKDLRANLNLGYDYSSSEGTVFVPDSAAAEYVRGGRNNQYKQKKKNKLLDFYLNYVKDISSISSRLDVMAGYGYQDFIRESPNYPDNRANGSEFAPPAPFPSYNQNTLISFFGRVNFSVMSKYLITATFRRDGSSRFSPDTRWGNFPSAAIAWSISEEPFLKGSKTLSLLKLRIGYGETGQQETGNDYQYIPNYFLGAQTAQYQFGNSYYQVNRPQAFDKDLRWETTSTYNAGIDYGFCDNRISGSIDFYFKKTEDLFARVQLPAGTNFSNELVTNIGTMENKGVEFAINASILKKTKLTWDAGFNLTYNKNEITRLTLVDDPNFIGFPVGGISGGVGNNIQINSIGYQPNAFFVLQQVYDQSGNPLEGIYVDRNNDGFINNLDYYHYKSPEPELMLGFHTSVSCGKWNFSTLLRSQFGNYMYNNVFSSAGTFQPGSLKFLGNVHRNFLETGFQNSQYFSDYYVENASFLKMDNLTASYDFGKVFNNKVNLRAQANVQNVFDVSKYRGLEPEIAGGIDNNFYPRPRIFSLGFNLDF